MPTLICPKCMAVHFGATHHRCPTCDQGHPAVYDWSNSDEYLKREAPRVLEERKETGLEGLVGGLAAVIINTEPEHQRRAVKELLRRTGHRLTQAFEDDHFSTCVLSQPGSADLLVRARKKGVNPFVRFNTFPKSRALPDTRLETFVFEVMDLENYVAIQKSRGVTFITDEIVRAGNFSFIQTIPSSFTGNSMGFLQWRGERGNYVGPGSRDLDWSLRKPTGEHLKNVKELDHTATRVRATDRDAAIIEFMELTNYNFEFAIYVKLFNSITNVARLSPTDFAMVFTSGIFPYISDQESGPTEKFIHNYGPRVHHMAFHTERIEQTFSALKADRMGFLIDLVGSPEEGLRQTFSEASEHTLLVNEYIHRYGNFDGFFTKSNVTLLTEATDMQ